MTIYFSLQNVIQPISTLHIFLTSYVFLKTLLALLVSFTCTKNAQKNAQWKEKCVSKVIVISYNKYLERKISVIRASLKSLARKSRNHNLFPKFRIVFISTNYTSVFVKLIC